MLRTLFFIALGLLTATSSAAQTVDDLFFYGRRNPAVGARMAGMGGAAVAGLSDWSAAYANPAGLAYLRGKQVVLSGHGYVQGTQSYAFGIDHEAEGASVGVASFATPLPTTRGALAVGAGYQETAVFTRGLTVVDGLGIYENHESGVLGEFSVAGAAAVSPRVVVGLSANAPIGRYEFNEQFFDGDSEDPSFDAEITGGNVRAGVSVQATPRLRVGVTAE
ncbi:MAG: hypothetical protein R3284_03925, partial [Rubricoccaceae bacterium]|nr:hypothetical protein [Rubricoccaceae bacterium]